MVRRSVDEWGALFEAQTRSGMTAASFCREHGLCPKYFSLRKKALGKATPFVRIEGAPVQRAVAMPHRVLLRLGRCEWELNGMGVDDLAHLMKALA